MIVAFSRKTNYARHFFPSQSRWIPKHASVLFYSGKEEDLAAASLFKRGSGKRAKVFPFSFSENGNFFPRPFPPLSRFTLLYSCAGTKTAGGGNAAL